MNEMKRSTIFSGKVASPLRLADTVSDAIAAALLEGSIAPGEALPPEGEIAREFGVSRPIAREALRQLTSAGLVSTQQGKVARAKALSGEPMDKIYGYAVRSSIKSLREANEMRRVMEVGVARLAATRRDGDGLAVMREALADLNASVGKPADFTDADIRFHLGMAMATGNSMIRIQIEGLRSIQRQVSEIFSNRSKRTQDDWRKTVARHAGILQAIEAGDAAQAEEKILAHYEAADIASVEVAEDERRGQQ
ncbi:FadR/GntR family transcriptional regulator [Tianweitania populi]|uniref:GntR family transcriptional regulator n=1 Tax=Tianweitania populi TaxID=1607949 RepID=A0A8J3DZ00_9HYPH|nr:FCD domain-containing protein [Tianweitania populi]GHD21781.1 GntR family transcriptional regulator [Tianweitania populi]